MTSWTIRRHLAAFIASICIVGVIAQAIFTQWSFRTGFAAYLEAVYLPRLEVIATRLPDGYHSTLEWQMILEDPNLWRRATSEVGSLAPPSDESISVATNSRSPGISNAPRQPPVEPSSLGADLPPEFRPSDSLEVQSPPGMGPPRRPSLIYEEALGQPGGIELVLLDANREFVFGNRALFSSRDYMEVPIEADNVVIGYLRSPGGMRIADVVDDNFTSRLRQQSMIIGAGVALLSLIAALVISRQFSRPVTRLNNCAEELMLGNYDAEIETDGPLEFGLLEKKFNRLARTLSANRTTQQHWIANISHELRTPLAVLQAELDAIKSGVRQFGPNQVESLLEECQRLNRLVDDLFFLSRSDAGDLSYRFSETDLNELMADLAEEFQVRVAAAGLVLDLQLPGKPVLVHADPGRLHQLIANLVNNSCAYTDTNGTIRLSLSQTRSTIVVVVEDTAPGVSEEERTKIFDRLFRVEKSRNRSEGGSGLGLAICRAIATAHGAKLEAFSSELGGLRMCLTLPKANDIVGKTEQKSEK